jgi:hypothetical protein
MRSHRRSWLGSWLLASGFVLMPALSATVRAQGGFGPDPFNPYNSQYAPYTLPMGPAGPAGGQGGAIQPRDGIRGANQFQDYLEGLGGGGRNSSDRANIGMPYYRSAVDPDYNPRGRGTRQYQPNTRANTNFEQAQQSVTEKYFAYYSERDPARRAELMKEYRAARRESSRILSGRGPTPSRSLESSSRLESGSRRSTRSGSAPPVPGTGDRAGSGDGRFGPPPPVPSSGSMRSSGSSSRGTSPSDILRRSEAMDASRGGLPSSRSSTSRSRRTTPSAATRAPASNPAPPPPGDTGSP